MSKLEELVPPLELCKLIPKGEFEDSAFIWDKTTSVGFWDGEDKDGNHIGGFGKIPHNKYRLRQNYSDRCRKHLKDQDIELDIFPAPTLQEIMANMPYCRVYKKTANFYVAVKEKDRVVSFNGATAALKLWLQMKGIEA
jgi:hypothetical protein